MHDQLIQQFLSDRGHYLGFLRVLTRDADMAEELFQELSLVVIRKIDTYDATRDFGSWIRGIARNLHLNAQKKQRRSRRLLAVYDPEIVEAVLNVYDDPSGQEAENRSELLQRLRQCIQQLPENHRKLLQGRYEHKHSAEELAELHNRTAASVSTILSRLRSALHDCMRRPEPGSVA